MQKISDWNGPLGGSRDNPPELLAKCKYNFEELARSINTAEHFSFFDHFEGDVIKDQWTITAGSDAPGAGAILEGVGGILRLTTGDSNASLAADGIQATSFLNFSAANGDLEANFKVKTDVITNLQLFLGLTDQRSALEMPFTLSGTTYTSVTSNGIGFLFDTAATTDTIRAVGVKADVDATHVDTGLAYVAATYKKLRVTVDKVGTAYFYIDGVLVATLVDAVTAATPLCLVICARAAGDTTSKNIDLDYAGGSMLT